MALFFFIQSNAFVKAIAIDDGIGYLCTIISIMKLAGMPPTLPSVFFLNRSLEKVQCFSR